MKVAAILLAIGIIVLALGLVRRQRPAGRAAGGDGGSGGTQYYASDTGQCGPEGTGGNDCAGDGGGDGGGGGGGDGGGGGGD